MSLSELLNSENESSTWARQKKQVYRILILSTLALFLLVVLFFVFYPDKTEEASVTDANEDQKVKRFSQLIKLGEELDSLRSEVQQVAIKTEDSFTLVDLSKTKKVPRPKPSSPSAHFLGYDPGEAFQDIETYDELTYVPTGAVFQAKLITPIKTSVQKTFVLAETTVEYRMDSVRKIEKGSRLIGRAYLNPILKGVVVEFNKIVTPRGRERRLQAIALSRNALPELEGLYFSDDLEKYSTALAFGFLSGFSDVARTRESTIYGSQPEVSVSNQVLSGLSTASFQVAEELLRDIREQAVEYVVVPAGESVFVALTSRYETKNQTQTTGAP